MLTKIWVLLLLLYSMGDLTNCVITKSVKRKKGEKNRAKLIENERDAYGKLIRSYLDTSVDPCDDFYQFSCGNYFKVHKEQYGLLSTDVFDIVANEMDEALHEILMQPPNLNNMMVPDKAKIFYQSCMAVNIFHFSKSDEYLKLINSLGGMPALDPNWSAKKFNWFNVSMELLSLGISAFWEIDIRFGSFFLRNREIGIHVELNDEQFSKEYAINKALIMKILTMYDVSHKNAKKIFRETVQLSKEWAEYMNDFTSDDDGDSSKSIDDLKDEVTEIDWDYFFEKLLGKTLDPMETIYSPSSFLKKFVKFFTHENSKAAANYMFMKLLYGLHSEFEEPKYQQKFCVQKLKNLMPHVITMMYLESKYHEESVEDEVMSMASYMRSAFKNIIKEATWMDMDTKRKALIKLRDMRMVVGDVEFTLDLQTLNEEYMDVHISPKNTFYEINLILLRHFVRKSIAEIFEPTPDRYESDVNAFYSPNENKMILPAGILRKPFFISALPSAYNYAAMGANILGHEMTHGFDSSGRNYDENGIENDWWSPESDAGFKERAKCFVEQYDMYRIPEMNINVRGNITLPENIADCGGVRQGYLAYQKWLYAHEGRIDISKETLPHLNMTNYQLFFLSYAQSYCGKYKRKMYQLFDKDVHAVNKFRVIGSVANFDEFGKQFNCKLGTTMNPTKKCVLW